MAPTHPQGDASCGAIPGAVSRGGRGRGPCLPCAGTPLHPPVTPGPPIGGGSRPGLRGRVTPRCGAVRGNPWTFGDGGRCPSRGAHQVVLLMSTLSPPLSPRAFSSRLPRAGERLATGPASPGGVGAMPRRRAPGVPRHLWCRPAETSELLRPLTGMAASKPTHLLSGRGDILSHWGAAGEP